jgi:hypothetical protein
VFGEEGAAGEGVVDACVLGEPTAGLPLLSNPDLITVGLNVPENAVCQISALPFHQLTTQIPREVSLGVPRGTEILRL